MLVELVGEPVVMEPIVDEVERIRHAWLTLNRQCNLRCHWCYAHSTEYRKTDDMPRKLAEQIINFLSKLQLEYVFLIGGEPTYYPFLEGVIRQIHTCGMKAFLLTNGLALSQRRYLDRLIEAGLAGVNLSMKGWSPESYAQNTGVNAYETMRRALRNIAESPIESLASFVISAENVDFYLNAVSEARAQGVKHIYLSFEHDFSALDGKGTSQDLSKIFYMIQRFAESYDTLQRITNGNFILHQSYPLCIWEKSLIQKLTDNHQIQTSCQLLERTGLVFDTDGSLIPCNSMYQVSIGKFGVDFSSKQSFETFWCSNRICTIYERFAALPSNTCCGCIEQARCGGGCIANWFTHDLEYWKNAAATYLQGNISLK